MTNHDAAAAMNLALTFSKIDLDQVKATDDLHLKEWKPALCSRLDAICEFINCKKGDHQIEEDAARKLSHLIEAIRKNLEHYRYFGGDAEHWAVEYERKCVTIQNALKPSKAVPAMQCWMLENPAMTRLSMMSVSEIEAHCPDFAPDNKLESILKSSVAVEKKAAAAIWWFEYILRKIDQEDINGDSLQALAVQFVGKVLKIALNWAVTKEGNWNKQVVDICIGQRLLFITNNILAHPNFGYRAVLLKATGSLPIQGKRLRESVAGEDGSVNGRFPIRMKELRDCVPDGDVEMSDE